MKILHILKKTADGDTKKIIEMHAVGNEVKIVELYKGSVNYDSFIADVFSYDKVFCW